MPQGSPAQQLGRLQGRHLRKHPVSQPLVVSPPATGLVGRGLADPARFPLTRPLPPPPPGGASRNEVFALGLLGLGRWVPGPCDPLGLLKAGPAAPHCSLDTHLPTGKWPLGEQGEDSEPRGRVWRELPRCSFLRVEGSAQQLKAEPDSLEMEGTAELRPSLPPTQRAWLRGWGGLGGTRGYQSGRVDHLLNAAGPQPFNSHNHLAWKPRPREGK